MRKWREGLRVVECTFGGVEVVEWGLGVANKTGGSAQECLDPQDDDMMVIL